MLPKPQAPWTFRPTAATLPSPLNKGGDAFARPIATAPPQPFMAAASINPRRKPQQAYSDLNNEEEDDDFEEDEEDDDDEDAYEKAHPPFPPEQAAVTNVMNKRPPFFSWFHRHKYDRERFRTLKKRHPSLARMPMVALPPRGWVKIKIWILQQDVYDAYQRQAQESVDWFKQQTDNDSIIQSIKQRQQAGGGSSRLSTATSTIPSIDQKFDGNRQSSFVALSSSGGSMSSGSDASESTGASSSSRSSNSSGASSARSGSSNNTRHDMFAQDQQSTHPAFRMDAQGLPAVTPPSIPTAWMEHLWIGRKHLTFVPAPFGAEQSHAVRWHVYDEEDDEHANFERLMQIVCNTMLRPSNVRAGLDDVYMVELSIHRWRRVVKEFRLKSGVGDTRSHHSHSSSSSSSTAFSRSSSSARASVSRSSAASVSAPSILARKRAQRRNAIYTAKMQSYIEHALLPGRSPDAVRNFLVFRKYRANAMTLAANLVEDAPVWAPPLSWPCTLKEWVKATRALTRIFQAQHEGQPPWMSRDEYQWLRNKTRDMIDGRASKDKHHRSNGSSRRRRKRAARQFQKAYLQSRLALPVVDKRAEAFRGSQHMIALYADVNPLELLKMPDWLAYYRRLLPSTHGTRYWHPDEVFFSLRYGLGKHTSSKEPSTVVGAQQPTLWFPPYRCYLEPFVANWDDLKLIGKGAFGTALRVKWPLKELTKVMVRSAKAWDQQQVMDVTSYSDFTANQSEEATTSVAVVVKLTNMIGIHPLQLNYMLHETSISLAMRHPNIIRTFGWFVRGDFLATVMERSDYDLAVAINYMAKRATQHAIPDQLAAQHPSVVLDSGNKRNAATMIASLNINPPATWTSPTAPLKRVGEGTTNRSSQPQQPPVQPIQPSNNRRDTLRTIEHWRTEVLEADATLSNDELLFILLDTARALEHLHANGIVHRDIKPSNVMISSPALRAKSPAELQLQRACIQTSVAAVGVLDANNDSIARVVDELTTRKSAKLIDLGFAIPMGSFESIAGTPEFMPPALHKHDSCVILYDSGAVDIYAFGKMIYYNIATYIPIPQPLLRASEVIATSEDGVSFYDEWNAHTLRVLLETIIGERLAKKQFASSSSSR